MLSNGKSVLSYSTSMRCEGYSALPPHDPIVFPGGEAVDAVVGQGEDEEGKTAAEEKEARVGEAEEQQDLLRHGECPSGVAGGSQEG